VLLAYLAALVSAATAFAASGCGESSKTSSTTNAQKTTTAVVGQVKTIQSSPPPVETRVQTVKMAAGKPLTLAQWTEQSNTICSHLTAKLSTMTVKTISDFARVLPTTAVYEHNEYAELAKLVPPASMAKDWQVLLTLTLQGSTNSAELGKEAQAGKFNINSALVTATTNDDERINHIAKRDGLKACAHV
jgi:hypothetical protein